MVIPFQIAVSERTAGAYGLRAQAAGRSTEAGLELPAPTGDPLADGAALGRAVFGPTLRQLLLDVARGADEAGARLQIQLRVTAPELAGLPWGWMSLGKQTVWAPGIREDYALVRVGAAARGPAALPAALPLRLLIAATTGYEAAADMLGAALAGEVRARRLIVDRLRAADPAGLAAALDEEPCHLLHLIGPALAGVAGGPARVALPRLRLGRGVEPQALANILGDFAELRLVTLASDGADAALALTELAAALHDAAGLATLALRGLDSVQAAEFSAACYGALVAGEPADLAATTGRARLADSGGPWGDPQIFIAPGGEALFRLGAAEPAAPARPPRVARPRPAPHEEPTRPVRPIMRPQPRPARDEATARSGWLTPRLAVLIVASLILILMVSRVWKRTEEPAPPPMPEPTTLVLPSAPSLAPGAFPTPMP